MKRIKKNSIILLAFVAIFSFQFSVLAQNNKQILSYEGKPLVEVEVNGQKTWALVDKEVYQTLFNVGDQSFFNFKLVDNPTNYQIELENEIKPFLRVSNLSLNYEGQALFGAKLAIDLHEKIDLIREKTGKRVSLIIGSNMIAHHTLTFSQLPEQNNFAVCVK